MISPFYQLWNYFNTDLKGIQYRKDYKLLKGIKNGCFIETKTKNMCIVVIYISFIALSYFSFGLSKK